MIKLDVAIATHRPNGIDKVADMNLPQVEGVRYVVSWQEHEGAPIPDAILTRGDIKVVRFSGIGVSANRNNAFRYSSAPIVLISDDDLIYTPSQLQSVIDTMEANPGVDIGTFQYKGDTKKFYPDKSCRIIGNKPKGLSFAAVEIAVRSRVLNRIRFDERFGPKGRLFTIGEDEKFMLDAVRMNLNCHFFPIPITTHPGTSTGNRAIIDPKAAQGTGCLIRGRFPWSWPLRIPLKAYRLWRKGSRFMFCLRHMLKGAMIECSTV